MGSHTSWSLGERLKMSLSLSMIFLITFALPNEGKPHFPLFYYNYMPSYPKMITMPYQYGYAYSYPIKSATNHEEAEDRSAHGFTIKEQNVAGHAQAGGGGGIDNTNQRWSSNFPKGGVHQGSGQLQLVSDGTGTQGNAGHFGPTTGGHGQGNHVSGGYPEYPDPTEFPEYPDSADFPEYPDEPQICGTNGGPKPNEKCVPFIFQGNYYDYCISGKLRPDPWCATKVDASGNYISGEWGTCNSYCGTTKTGNSNGAQSPPSNSGTGLPFGQNQFISGNGEGEQSNKQGGQFSQGGQHQTVGGFGSHGSQGNSGTFQSSHQLQDVSGGKGTQHNSGSFTGKR